jgi:aquaporin Z
MGKAKGVPVVENWQKYAAEAYGTFVLVGIGTGAIMAAAVAGGGIIEIAFAFGLALVAGLYTVGRISGGHFNPAVTLGMFLDQRISAADMVGYWVAQVAGGILASLTLAFIISKNAVADTITVVNSQFVDTFGGFVGEALLTTIFVMAVLVMSKSTSYTKYIGIGFTLTAVHLIGIPFTGASVNPARSLAPAIVGGEYNDIWIYLAGPAAGAVLAWVLYKFIVTGDTDLVDDIKEMV